MQLGTVQTLLATLLPNPQQTEIKVDSVLVKQPGTKM